MTEIAPQLRSTLGRSAVARPTMGQRLQRTQTTLHNAMGELYKSKTAFAGFLMLLFLFIACLATPYATRYDPVKQNYAQMLKPPSEQHYLGTDKYGRDILSRILWGGRRPHQLVPV